jgi:hypothetical protein
MEVSKSQGHPRGGTTESMSAGRGDGLARAVLVMAEIVGMVVLWSLVPLAWIWTGKQVGAATGSLMASLSAAFLGFVASVVVIARILQRVDALWIALRRRAGYEQKQGALTQVVVVSTALGLLAFYVWFYLLSNAFVITFMPTH